MATKKKAASKSDGKNELVGGSGDPRRGSDLEGGGPKGGGKSGGKGGKKKK